MRKTERQCDQTMRFLPAIDIFIVLITSVLGQAILTANQNNGVISLEVSGLLNLDEWNLMSILDFLDFDDLLALSDISPTFQQLISDHYMVHKFRVHEQVINIHSNNNRANIFYNDFILIGNLASAKVFLRHFGQLVRKLVFNSETEGNEDVRRYVTQHCSENLSELELIKPSGFFLTTDTHRSFKNLKKLRFSYPQQINISPAISQIYPALQELSIGLYVHRKRKEYTEFLRKLLQSTPHLRVLSINELPTYNALRFINDNQPHLEALKISYDLNIFQNLNDEMVHFNAVKKLSVEILNSMEIAEVIAFPAKFEQLQILEIQLNHFSQMPFDIIQQSVNVRALALPKWHEMADLIHILNNVSLTHSIEDISVVWSSEGGMRSDYTINLLADYPKLRNIKFIVIDTDDLMVERDALIAMIPIEWTICKVERSHEAAFQSFITIQRNQFHYQ